ncbi:glycerophosphoryl diester phosphodiesterase [Ereboglobus sp. PH5-10]|uniref:glycerophosphodiester phosphodiesterase n=1 Tax=Ereboglobus sp. PH5-10 TaxID=2940629 RepID=UPI00240660E3|nr:glycerophosphodiester phosphodiesterase family protein [Ereboglobus sp. PH5-10]MDF9826085.1 glycerophosphoryl diester phosphodiesterase [Ereboglobus sp. PH5-10]
MNTRPNSAQPTRRDFITSAAALTSLFLLPSALRATRTPPKPVFVAGKNGGLFSGPNTPQNPRFIAHRGSHSLAPENSLPALEEAAKRGFWAVESDVRRTKDGILVCHHDATLKKMFGVNERVANLTWDEIKKLTYTRGNGRENYPAARLRMPLFAEYIEICRDHGSVPFIEIKDDVTAEAVRMVCDMKMEERSVISSSKFPHIEAARAASKKVFLHHIFSDEEHMQKLVRLGHAGVSHKRTELDDISAALVEKTHALGLRVCLRAGDTKETVLKMLELGLDYIPTNKILEM